MSKKSMLAPYRCLLPIDTPYSYRVSSLFSEARYCERPSPFGMRQAAIESQLGGHLLEARNKKLRRTMRKILIILTVVTLLTSVGLLVAELGSNNPTDDQVTALRVQEGGSGGAGVFDIPTPDPGTTFHPVKRVAR